MHKKLKNENAELNNELTKSKELLAKWVKLFSPKVANIPPLPIQVETEHIISGGKK